MTSDHTPTNTNEDGYKGIKSWKYVDRKKTIDFLKAPQSELSPIQAVMRNAAFYIVDAVRFSMSIKDAEEGQDGMHRRLVDAAILVKANMKNGLIDEMVQAWCLTERLEKGTTEAEPGPDEQELKLLRTIAKVAEEPPIWFKNEGRAWESHSEAAVRLYQKLLRMDDAISDKAFEFALDLVDLNLLDEEYADAEFKKAKPKVYAEMERKQAIMAAGEKALAAAAEAAKGAGST